jgi:arabinose-5-phosphate isomerase
MSASSPPKADAPSSADAARHVAEGLRAIAVEQAGLAALATAIEGRLCAPFAAAVEALRATPGRAILTGMGKSGHIARKIAATLASTGTAAHFVHPAEASHGDLGMIQSGDVTVALSWSGETPELADIITYTRRFGVTLIAITSRADSALAKSADIALVLPVMPEACPNGLAPTTSTTMQLALGDALAMAVLSAHGYDAASFRDLHPGGKLGARLKKAADVMHAGAETPIALETASLSEAIVEMTSKRFGMTALVDADGRLTGVLTDGDLRRALQSGRIDRPAAEVMTRKPTTIAPDMLAQEALKLMNDRKITALLVVQDGRPVGALHIHDLLRIGAA